MGSVAVIGVSGTCKKADVYPTDVRSALKLCIEGVVALRWAVEGLSKAFKEPDEARADVMDALRLQPIEGRRRGERGERDAGDPGRTWAAQAVIVEKVFERGRVRRGAWGATTLAYEGGEGSGCVGRFLGGGG